jgi:hypothetical protein
MVIRWSFRRGYLVTTTLENQGQDNTRSVPGNKRHDRYSKHGRRRIDIAPAVRMQGV